MFPAQVIKFPKKYRPHDCQGEIAVFQPLRLIDRLKRIRDGLDAGMTTADVQLEYEAQQAEEVIAHWTRKLAENPRRSPDQAAAVLCALAGRLNGEIQA